MTTQEHELIVTALARQMMVVRAMADALVAHGVLNRDDVSAYGRYLDLQTQVPAMVMDRTRAMYQDIAKVMGLNTGL